MRTLSCATASLILLLLAGCQSTSSWAVSHIQAGDASYNSSRLSYHVRDIVNEVGVEMIWAQGEINTYLVVHAQTIPPYQGHPQKALVVIESGETKIRDLADLHAGGQRLLLASHLQSALIALLEQNQIVTISLEGYKVRLDPKDFAQQYGKLKAEPLTNPFQLPFQL